VPQDAVRGIAHMDRMAVPRLDAQACRRLLMRAQQLCVDPEQEVTPDTLYALIVRLGFVQLDSINVITRAQHLTLFSRLHRYAPSLLTRLMEQERRIFEHWTHDASFIPTEFFCHWRHRFDRYAERVRRHAWWQSQLGPDAERVIAHVEARIAREGPLRSQDFEHPEARSGTWWAWKPQKAALEYLWRRGRLAVHSRRAFQKVYDLTERVLPEAVRQPTVSWDEHVDWACAGALDRLGAATATEVAAYWDAVDAADARRWCEQAARDGRIHAVSMEGIDGRTLAGYAVADWAERLAAWEPPRGGIRLLCPFDPIVRDRKRLERVFGFNYRFEAFVPPPQRTYGYYVLPLLEGERFVGRTDLKLHRDAARLEVRGLWWERGVRVTAPRRRSLQTALERLARFLGAAEVATAPGHSI
jgi:uncharacterized protein